jgi:hypothetical protein
MGGGDEGAVNTYHYDLQPGDLAEGTNILAVEAHQASLNSSDLGLDVRLAATKPSSGDSTVALNQTGTVMARVLDAGEWSALTEADFIVGTTASDETLVVSEMMYNPLGSSEDTEYIELMNISPDTTIDLTGVSFSDGISYTFPAGVVLGPMERLVVVPSQSEFAAHYPSAGVQVAPGEYLGNLSNGGEAIEILAQDGSVIRSFSYDDKSPWPTSPDGDGPSLVLVNPASNPDHSLPENWRPSAAQNGTPGGSDSVEFSGDPLADSDGDGRTALLEHALGTSDSSPDRGAPVALSSVTADDGSGPAEHLGISFRRNLAADDVRYAVEVSSDLKNWSRLDTVLVSETDNLDGTTTQVWRSVHPVSSMTREFIRLSVSKRR